MIKKSNWLIIQSRLRKWKVKETRVQVIEKIKQAVSVNTLKEMKSKIEDETIQLRLYEDGKITLKLKELGVQIEFKSSESFTKKNKLGEWLILKEREKLNPIKRKRTFFEGYFSEARKIEAIEVRGKSLSKRVMYVFEGDKVIVNIERLRVATEEEIKEKQIKKIFK